MRWASPPESVVACWPRWMYPRPTSFRVWSFFATRGTFSKNSSASLTVMSRTSAMVLPLEADLQGLPVVALALAGVAGDVDVREEVHLDLEDAVPLARLAAPALHVEGEPARLVAAGPGLGDLGEEVPDGREEPGVGGGVAARGPADGGLVDLDDLVHAGAQPSMSRCAPGFSTP